MIEKFIFNEDIIRVYKCMTNSQILSQCIIKDYITDIKFVNNKKKEKTLLENSTTNQNISKSMIKYNDSSQNLIGLTNVASKANTSIHPVTAANNSFFYLNSSSFKTLSIDKLEGLILECKYKKKYILLLKISKIYESKRNYKFFEIECLEMNHFENAFNIKISFIWNSSELQTIILLNFFPKTKIMEEIICREFDKNDRKKIYDNMRNYLFNDLTNLEHCATSLIFANMQDISLYISEIKRVIKLSKDVENKKIEIYESPLVSSMQNCRIYDDSNKILKEFILTGYYANKDLMIQIKWDEKLYNKINCVYRIALIYLEENLTLIILRNIWKTHVPSQLISEVNIKKKSFFDDIQNYFIKKHGLNKVEEYFKKNLNDIKLKLGIKNFQKKERNPIDLDMIIHNDGTKNGETKNKENEDDSLFLNNSVGINLSNNVNKDVEKLFSDTIQNLSEIENMNSLFINDDENNN